MGSTVVLGGGAVDYERGASVQCIPRMLQRVAEPTPSSLQPCTLAHALDTQNTG